MFLSASISAINVEVSGAELISRPGASGLERRIHKKNSKAAGPRLAELGHCGNPPKNKAQLTSVVAPCVSHFPTSRHDDNTRKCN